MTTLSKWRINYPDRPIKLNEMLDNPFGEFERWIVAANEDGVVEPNAMTISTVIDNAVPDARVVLLRHVSDKGFIFYTNYKSAKGQQLLQNNNMSAVFWWPQSHRQIRIMGKVSKIAREDSEQYFATRDRETQIGAWASIQSKPIENYGVLQNRLTEYEAKFKNIEVPCPPYWGGYILEPIEIEFWQGRHSRLHDRIVFTRDNIKTNDWQISRLAP